MIQQLLWSWWSTMKLYQIMNIKTLNIGLIKHKTSILQVVLDE